VWIDQIRKVVEMELKRQNQEKTGLISRLSLKKWKVWTVVMIAAISLMLSSCGGEPGDYSNQLGDPSHYKELYQKAMQDKEASDKKIYSLTNENTKLKEKYAALKATKEKNVVLAERERALDEKEKALFEKEEQIKQDQAKTANANSTIFDKSVEIGKTMGQLEKDEERIKELLRQIKNINGQLSFLRILVSILIFAVFAVLAYIFLSKYGVIRAVQQDNFTPSPKTINTSVIGNNAEALESSEESPPKSLSAGTLQEK